MATAILHSIKQGAWIAIALYVVFITVVTLTSMNPSINATDAQVPAVVHSTGAEPSVPVHTS